MKNINIGTKSSNDWIGEELVQSDVPADFKFKYSVIAQHKVQTYVLPKGSFHFLPLKLRNNMNKISQTRDSLIEQRIKEQYQYLKSINENVNENKKESLKLSQLKLKKAMNEAQEVKRMGFYAF